MDFPEDYFVRLVADVTKEAFENPTVLHAAETLIMFLIQVRESTPPEVRKESIRLLNNLIKVHKVLASGASIAGEEFFMEKLARYTEFVNGTGDD